MSSYQIDWIYFIILFLIIGLSFFKEKRSITIVVSLILLIFFSFSYNGADYLSYKLIYKNILAGIDLNQVHGEFLFKIYMKFIGSLGFTYEGFKKFNSLFFIGLMLYSLYKVSSNYILSVYILYAAYTLYLFTLYRQLMVMSLLFYALYLYKTKKRRITLIVSILSSFIHISGVWVVIFFIFLILKKDINIKPVIVFILIILSFIFRVVLLNITYFLIKGAQLIGRGEHLKFYLETSNYINIGIVTRLIMVFIILVFSKCIKDRTMRKMTYFFIISMILNIVLPIEGIAGRLFNNGRILEVLIIPYIYMNLKFNNKMFFKYTIIIYYIIIFIAQLIRQEGYYPYRSMLFM